LAGAPCLVAHHSIHPDQHEIVVNPANPTQFFEGSDGGMNRSSGGYTNLTRACSFRAAPTLGVPALSGNNLTQCQRLLSRIPPNPPLFNGTGICNQPVAGCVRTHPLYQGGQHVWRSWAWDAGSSITVPQQITPDIAGYENNDNCSDLYVTPLTCGDAQALGGAG